MLRIQLHHKYLIDGRNDETESLKFTNVKLVNQDNLQWKIEKYRMFNIILGKIKGKYSVDKEKLSQEVDLDSVETSDDHQSPIISGTEKQKKDNICDPKIKIAQTSHNTN